MVLRGAVYFFMDLRASTKVHHIRCWRGIFPKSPHFKNLLFLLKNSRKTYKFIMVFIKSTNLSLATPTPHQRGQFSHKIITLLNKSQKNHRLNLFFKRTTVLGSVVQNDWLQKKSVVLNNWLWNGERLIAILKSIVENDWLLHKVSH